MNRTIFSVAGVLSASSLLLVDSAVKGTVLLALAAVVALILRRDSAATRHLVWQLAIVAMLVVPVLSAMLPQWRVLPAWMSSSRPVVADISPPSISKSPGGVIESPEMAAPVEVERPSATVFQPATVLPDSQPALATPEAVPSPAVRSWNWIHALPLVWVIGFAVLMLRLSAARWMLWNSERLATVVWRRAAPQLAFKSQSDSNAANDPIVMAMETICSQLGIGHPVNLLIHPDKTIPVVWGIVRCRLMLPAAARLWSDEQLQSVLLHELAHIKRRDTLVQLLTQIACALHWFNPLVWFAAWRLDVERERSCDDLVLASGVRPSAYAAHLLDVVTGLAPARWTKACGLAMARKSSLEGRLTAVLGKDLNRRGVSVALAGLALAVAVGIAVPIAMLRAADEWNPPNGAHIGSNEFSAFCIHDGKEATFIIAYQGDFDSTSRSSSNSKARTWTDSVTLTAKQPGIVLSFHRTHTAPDKLSITTAPTEARNLSKPALPPREFGQKEYDFAKGRVFLLSDNGAVRQLDIATPIVTDQESAKKLAALIAAIPPQDRQDVAPTPNLTGKLAPETIVKLKWGDPVNGLRMALAYPPALGDGLLGKKPHFELVVQNVSEKEIHFLASDDAPNPREFNFRADNRTVLVIADKDTAKAEWHLQPGHCGVLRMFTKEESNDDGKTVSAGIEGDLSKIDRNHAVAEMEIAKAPAGAWTGKLITGKTRGSADVFTALAPMHKDAKALLEVWQRYARANGDFPGALVGELAAVVRQFIKYNPTSETVPKFNEVLPRLDATHDWKPADVIALLDEVAGVQGTLLEQARWKGTRDTIRDGDVLPIKYADVTWGEEQSSGLRAAWVLEPSEAEHRIGTALKARLLVQNRGQVPVMLQVPTFHQGWVRGTDSKGSEVQVSGISWTTMALLNTVRLGPGASIEINTPGVGIGPRAGMGPWAGPRVGSRVLAKPGDELTLTYSLVPLDGSGVGVSEDDPHVSGPGWWLAHIKARLNRELPFPADAAERTRLLDRAVRELFAAAPTAEETEAFVADKTPEAFDSLIKRLAARGDVVSFSGKLPTASVKFRVLAADANADKQPRVVLGPGEYPLPSATPERGDATLKIVGRPVGDRRTNDAQLLFEPVEFTGKLPPDPNKLEVPDGWGTWAIVCRPSDGFFYLLHKGSVRKIDYSKPLEVTDTPANDLPAEFRDEVKRILDIHKISEEQQTEIFDKPAAPAATPAPKVEKPKEGADLRLTPDTLLGSWHGMLHGERLLLSFHRPPVETDINADLYQGDATIGVILTFKIALDGKSVTLLMERGPAKDPTEYGRLTLEESGKLLLEVGGNAPGKSVLTKSAEAPATEPQQKEARELFELWKITANADGTFPGTFIGRLATEVRAYVKANPNLDSAAKLPKMLPRFVTSRDWTQAEAIKLLDDVAYYASAPIAAYVANAKLPSDSLWRSKVEFQDIPVKVEKWSEPKDGLRIGMRVADADWRIGGKVKLELWLHNASDKDLSFKTTGPNRQDVGVAVSARDSDGGEHWAANGNVLILAIPMDCNLPAGHVAVAKQLTVSFDAPENKEAAWMAPKFRDLAPGKYALRCLWVDAQPTLSVKGQWTGELKTPEVEFTLAAGVTAPQVSEAPKTTVQEPFTAWGKEVCGLQAGLGFKAGAERAYHHGETVMLVVRVRNVGNEDVKFQYYPKFLSENSPTVLDETGKRVSLRGNTLPIVKRDIPKEVNLAAGKEIELYERELRLAKGNEDADELKTRDIFPKGKFLIQHEKVIGQSAQASDKLDPDLEKLATGKLELEVKEPEKVASEKEPFTAWGREVGGLQAGLGFKAGEKRAYIRGEWATLVVRVRNVGKEEVKFQYLRQFFVEQPPTVFNEKGELKQLGRIDAFGEHFPVEVNLAAGKEIELYELRLYLGTGSDEGIPKYPYIFGTGKFQVQYEKVLGNSSSGSIKLDPALSKLATGKLELKVYPVSSPPAADIPSTVLQPVAEGVADTTTQPDWVLAWDFRISPSNQQYSKMRISKDGKLETILRKPPSLRAQLSSDELSKLLALVAKNPQAKSQPMSKIAEYSKAISPTPELFEALKKVQVRSEIIAVVHEGELFELDLNTTETLALNVQLKKFVGLAAIGGSEELSRLVELANRELARKYSNLSTPIDPTSFYDAEVDLPSGKISVWFNYSINPESTDGQMVLLRISENGQPSIEQVILPKLVKIDELNETEWKLPNAGANIVRVPDDQYVKSGFPVDEMIGEGVMWNNEQNGLSLGYRITGDEWRILGKEVKVELWVQNPGDKEVKFQSLARPDIGLRMKLKDETGVKGAKEFEHESNIVPNDRPPYGELRLLPPGHAFKVKEFTVSLLWPENDVPGIKGHFFAIEPGAYKFHCELELPGFSATGEGGKQITPAAGEWTGKLTTRGLNIMVIAPDAPAPKPRIEHADVALEKDGTLFLNGKQVTLDELKAQAAKDAKKMFTIRADNDVPYAKVIEVVESLKAAGVTEFSFAEARVGAGKSRAAIRGKVLKPDGSPAADVQVRVDDGIERWKFRGEGIPDLPQGVKTAADGTFSIEVPKHSVATNYEAFASSDDFAPLNVKVPQGGDVGVMQFAKGSDVNGRVFGLDGAGLAKVGIWCKQLEWHGRGPAPSKLTSTSADGTFSIPSIATGKHLLVILTRDLGAKELTVAFANHVIEAKDDARVGVEIRPLPTVNLTLDARVLRGNPEFPDYELRVSGTLPDHKAGEPASFWTRQETTKLTKGKHTIAVPAGLQNATVRADRIYMRRDDEPVFLWKRESDEKQVSTNTLELGLMDKPQTISLTVQDAAAAEAPKTEKPK